MLLALAHLIFFVSKNYHIVLPCALLICVSFSLVPSALWPCVPLIIDQAELATGIILFYYILYLF